MLVGKNYLKRVNSTDRRRFNLELTTNGNDLLQKIQPLINEHRNMALNEIPENELQILQAALSKITLTVQ